jgi:four helix bundle protein
MEGKKTYRLEDLRIYQLAEGIADAIWNLIVKWKPFARETVGKQLVRAADSIGANIAEGYGRFHYREDIQFLYYARGSIKETHYWISQASKRKLISEDDHNRINEMLNELLPQLNSYITSIRKKSSKV